MQSCGRLALLLFAMFLGACSSNPFEDYYSSRAVTYPSSIAPQVRRIGSPEEGTAIMEEGFEIIGYSDFVSNSSSSLRQAKAQGKRVGATLVLLSDEIVSEEIYEGAPMPSQSQSQSQSIIIEPERSGPQNPAMDLYMQNLANSQTQGMMWAQMAASAPRTVTTYSNVAIFLRPASADALRFGFGLQTPAARLRHSRPALPGLS
jgi:hypothetical protein